MTATTQLHESIHNLVSAGFSTEETAKNQFETWKPSHLGTYVPFSGNLWENGTETYGTYGNLRNSICHISEVEYQYIKALIKPMTTNSSFGFRGFWVSETWKLVKTTGKPAKTGPRKLPCMSVRIFADLRASK